MESLGWTVKPATAQEDYRNHIDAWVKRESDFVPYQIKYRDSGDDILVEVIKYWKPEMFKAGLQESDYNGRDMFGESVYQIGLNMGRNKLRIRSIVESHEIAKVMTKELSLNYPKRTLVTDFGTIRLICDPANGREKIIAYIRPEVFVNREDISLPAPLW